jgi:hypothetical protein
MTKEQLIDLLRLLSALESWSFSTGKMLPDYLYEDLTNSVDALKAEVLK